MSMTSVADTYVLVSKNDTSSKFNFITYGSHF